MSQASEKHRWRLQAYERGSRSAKAAVKRQNKDDSDKQVVAVTQISPARNSSVSSSSTSTDGAAYMQSLRVLATPDCAQRQFRPFRFISRPHLS